MSRDADIEFGAVLANVSRIARGSTQASQRCKSVSIASEIISEPETGVTSSPVERMDNLLEEIVLADQLGLDVFRIGEHHRSEFVDSAPSVILAAAAARAPRTFGLQAL
jgi:hypothetical protein